MRKTIFLFVSLVIFFGVSGFASAQVANDNLVQSWNEMSQGMAFNPTFQGGEAQKQNLPGYPGVSNPGSPTHVPGQMPGTHPNFTGREYYQFLGGRLTTMEQKDEKTGMVTVKQVWKFEVAPVFDAFTLQPYIAAGKEQEAKYKITASWPKAMELGETPSTMALNEKAFAVYDLAPVCVYALEGENVSANSFFLLATAHEAARKAGFHLSLLEQGGYFVTASGQKGWSFSIGGTGLFGPHSGGGGGIGPYANYFNAGTPVIPWFRFQVLAPRATLEAKKAELRKNGNGGGLLKKGEAEPTWEPPRLADEMPAKPQKKTWTEAESQYVPVGPEQIVPLPLKKQGEPPAEIPPIAEIPKTQTQTPEPQKPAPTLTPKPDPEKEILKDMVRKLGEDTQNAEAKENALQEKVNKLESEKSDLAKRVTERVPVKICPVEILFERGKIWPTKDQEPKIREMAECMASPENTEIREKVKTGELQYQLVGGADWTPGLTVVKDRVNPWTGIQRVLAVYILLKPELLRLGFSEEEIAGIAKMSASNLKENQPEPNAAPDEESQKRNRRVTLRVVIGPINK